MQKRVACVLRCPRGFLQSSFAGVSQSAVYRGLWCAVLFRRLFYRRRCSGAFSRRLYNISVGVARSPNLLSCCSVFWRRRCLFFRCRRPTVLRRRVQPRWPRVPAAPPLSSTWQHLPASAVPQENLVPAGGGAPRSRNEAATAPDTADANDVLHQRLPAQFCHITWYTR
ncbi:hypothetical protein BRADI_3g12025v3 [Brachypodium distachyon]|uniref:Uncharacterized protein n=1 Tax=Brachypodium distachyon TaxID=15368 RepID=A0A2K2CWP7_BRADI|nr:hypothetical protein BRADI_3g12025v3 [Brachypodium distachyon]